MPRLTHIWTLVGLVFGCVLFIFGVGAAGVGHGTYLPMAIYGAPFSAVPFAGMFVTPVWWTALGWTISSRRRTVALELLAANIIGAALFDANTRRGFVRRWSIIDIDSYSLNPCVSFILMRLLGTWISMRSLRSFPMKKGLILAVSCSLAFPTIAFAKTAHTKVTPTDDVRKIPPSIDACTGGFVLRQDLFDRNNPNNLRSDWPAPPAQPGQF